METPYIVLNIKCPKCNKILTENVRAKYEKKSKIDTFSYDYMVLEPYECPFCHAQFKSRIELEILK